MPPRSRGKVVTRKDVIDTQVAAMLGIKRRDVGKITEVFLRIIVDELSEMNIVHLDNLGEIRVVPRQGVRQNHALLTKGTWGHSETKERTLIRVDRKYYVSFKKSPTLRLAIQARQGAPGKIVKVMEKLGVDEEQTENEKKASDGCPNCGAKVERHGSVLACPKCGTEPFESGKKL